MKKFVVMSWVLLAGFWGFTDVALAHNRHYVWTEEYRTLPRNTFELEGKTTLKVPDAGKSNENTWKYEPELEYGITDHWNIAHYQIWETENQSGFDDAGVKRKDPTRYEGFKFESKYRIGEKGKYWVDPLVYLELESEVRPEHRNNTIEGKLVLSKDFQKFNVTYNQIIESQADRGGRTTHEYSIAVNYEILSSLFIGCEMNGQYWQPSSHRNEIGLGPTVGYANQYFWVAAGVLIGANEAADDLQARVSVGIPIG